MFCIHRLEQIKRTIYYHVIAVETISETVYSTLKNKKNIVNSIIEKNRSKEPSYSDDKKLS